jgi:hypothetical protein
VFAAGAICGEWRCKQAVAVRVAVSGYGEFSFCRAQSVRAGDDFVIRVKSVRFEALGDRLVVRTGREHGDTAELIFAIPHISPA